VQAALQYQAAVARHGVLGLRTSVGLFYAPEQETALMAARRRRAIAAFDEQ
jgi:hypothetical protein